MKKIMEFEKHMPARTFIQMAGRLPEFRRALKSLVNIKYFLPPFASFRDIKQFLVLPVRNSPEIVYPLENKQSGNRELAIITGATSGIGKAYARFFAGRGYDILITGRRKEVIAAVADEIRREFGVRVEVVIADLSVKEDMAALLRIMDRQQPIAVLVNNAGYGMNLSFSEDEIDHQLAMMRVHVNAPLILTHKVLPQMIERKNGIIINVSSMAAYFPASGSSMYVGTKSFLKSFTESLFLDVGHYGIKVQCLCPGFTSSDFHRNHNLMTGMIKNGFLLWMEPSDVVKFSIDNLDKGKVICIPGRMNRLLIQLVSVMPRNLYYRLSVKVERKIRPHGEVTENVYTPANI